jgi:hypothetical protein
MAPGNSRWAVLSRDGRTRRASNRCQGRLTDGPQGPPAPLEAMILGEFEPSVWIPSRHAAAQRGTISLRELAGLDVIHGPRRAQAGTYDAWTKIVQAADPRFEFTDPPFRSSLPLTLAFAAAADRATAVLTGPATAVGSPATPMIEGRVLLPGITTLSRLVTEVRRAGLEAINQALAGAAPAHMRQELAGTLAVPDGKKVSTLEWMRTPVTRLSGNGMVQALDRAAFVLGLGTGAVVTARRWRR